MRDGLVDTVQIIFNLFQQAASQILPVAEETGTGVLVRVPLDEGSLSGTYPADHQFAGSITAANISLAIVNTVPLNECNKSGAI